MEINALHKRSFKVVIERRIAIRGFRADDDDFFVTGRQFQVSLRGVRSRTERLDQEIRFHGQIVDSRRYD